MDGRKSKENEKNKISNKINWKVIFIFLKPNVSEDLPSFKNDFLINLRDFIRILLILPVRLSKIKILLI